MINTEFKDMKPVAVWYGGTFDPPHRGHQQIVHQLTTLPYIDTVIVTPAYRNPFKASTLTPAEQRLKWIQMLFDDPSVVIDTGEVKAERSVYTIDTIRRLNASYDIRYIAIGSDNLERIEAWHDFETLNAQMTWIVFGRDSHTSGYEKLRDFRSIPLHESASSTHIRSGGKIEKVDPSIAKDVKKLLTKGNA